MRKVIFFAGMILFLGVGFCFSQTEQVTITTYYPSPYGVYRELRSQRQAIGDTYYDFSQHCWNGDACAPNDDINTNADLVVEGNVGIGTTNPNYNLEVNGTLQADDYYSDDGSQGLTQTLDVRAAGGVLDCTITVKDGLITASTCP